MSVTLVRLPTTIDATHEATRGPQPLEDPPYDFALERERDEDTGRHDEQQAVGGRDAG